MKISPSLRPIKVWCPLSTTQALPSFWEISRNAFTRSAWTSAAVEFKSRGFAGMGRHDADGVFWNGIGREPVERARVGDDGHGRMPPEIAQDLFQFSRHVGRGQAGTDDYGREFSWQLRFWRPEMNHHGLQLCSDGNVNALLSKERDESGLGALRSTRGEHRCAVITEAAGDDGEMAERAFVAINGAARRKVAKILGDGPIQFALVWAVDKAGVFGDD